MSPLRMVISFFEPTIPSYPVPRVPSRYNQAMATPKVLTGARAILKLNGNLTVFATDVSWSVETDYKPIPEIDNSLPAELSPGAIRVQVTVTNLRVAFGSPAVERLQPTILNAMTQPYTMIEVRDRGTDATIIRVPKSMLVRRTGHVSSRSMATESWTFVGIGYWDERAPGQAKKAAV